MSENIVSNDTLLTISQNVPLFHSTNILSAGQSIDRKSGNLTNAKGVRSQSTGDVPDGHHLVSQIVHESGHHKQDIVRSLIGQTCEGQGSRKELTVSACI